MSSAVHTEFAPAAIGPYSQAIKVGDVVYTSGQIPVNPATGEVPGDITGQTEQALANLEAVLKAAGASVAQIVKMTVFVKDLNDFGTLNAAYAKFFDAREVANYPARSCVEVARLPKDVDIELEAVAYL